MINKKGKLTSARTEVDIPLQLNGSLYSKISQI